jgi:serine/threonine-protein kinase
LLPNQTVIRNSLRQAQSWLQLDRKLAACLAGKDRPTSPRQALDLAGFCGEYRQRYYAAVRLFIDAFGEDPTLAHHVNGPHRYIAACCALWAAAGRGYDARNLADRERDRLRRQALDWLRADLDAWRRCVTDGNPRDRSDAEAEMRYWRSDLGLSTVRHSWSLLRLPADERRAWQRLWIDVAALHRRVAP